MIKHIAPVVKSENSLHMQLTLEQGKCLEYLPPHHWKSECITYSQSSIYIVSPYSRLHICDSTNLWPSSIVVFTTEKHLYISWPIQFKPEFVKGQPYM